MRCCGGQILFTYLHLAATGFCARLIRSGVVAMRTKTVTDERGGLPLLPR